MARPKKAEKSEYQKRLDEGFTPEQARELVMAAARTQHLAEHPMITVQAGPPLPANVAQDQRTLGPDPEMVRRQQAAAAAAPPPAPNVRLDLEIEPRWCEVLDTYAEIQRGKRNLEEVSRSQALVWLLRWASIAEPDIVMVRTSGKGKSTFVHPSQKGAA